MKCCKRNRFGAPFGTCVMMALLATAGWSQSLTWLGVPSQYYTGSAAYDVSSDGSVVVGQATGFYGGPQPAFRWVNGVMQDLGMIDATAYGVSANGGVVVGTWIDGGDSCAFRWNNGVTDCILGVEQHGDEARDVSADGDVVVGYLYLGGLPYAFYWKRGSFGILYLYAFGGSTTAYGVSADGRFVVGGAYHPTIRQSRAVLWEIQQNRYTVRDLGTLGGTESLAFSVSADGRVVVGWSRNAQGQPNAFRWQLDPTTGTGVMTDLGTLPDSDGSTALSVSADGSVVVGYATFPNQQQLYRALRWRNGIMDDLTVAFSTLLIPGSYLAQATAISPDGRYIVGWGYNAATGRIEAFLLDTGFPLRGDVDRNGCVDDADLLAVLFAFGGRGYRNEDLNWDSTVDDADLLPVLFNFGRGCR